jgi:hypothetical protein
LPKTRFGGEHLAQRGHERRVIAGERAPEERAGNTLDRAGREVGALGELRCDAGRARLGMVVRRIRAPQHTELGGRERRVVVIAAEPRCLAEGVDLAFRVLYGQRARWQPAVVALTDA